MAYKELARRTVSDKVLWDKVFEIASNPKYFGHQEGPVLTVYRFLLKNLLEKIRKSKLNQINN